MGQQSKKSALGAEHWTPRTSLECRSKDILRKSLVDPKKILLPPLHIKLAIMKQFVKALPKTGNCFKYLCKKLLHLSEAKLNEGTFIDPDIRKLMFNEDFLLTMSEVEREAWIAFKCVVTKFLENNKDSHYVTIVANVLEKFKALRLKIHFLKSHLDFFSKILVQQVSSTENVSTKTLSKWKDDTRVSGMLI
jgi:hypothetical protein